MSGQGCGESSTLLLAASTAFPLAEKEEEKPRGTKAGLKAALKLGAWT